MSEARYENISYCEVPGSLRNVAQAAKHLREFCEQRLIDPTLWSQLEIAFCEGLNNAIEHGCREDESKIVHILWKWEENWLTIEIEDPGRWEADTEKTSLPDDPLEESGRGCFIIDSVFDQFDHENTDYGHKIVLKKELHRPFSAVEKLQETYESLLSATGELNRSYAHASVTQGLANDLSSLLSPTEFIAKSIQGLRAVADFPQVEVWVADGSFLENRFPDDLASLKNRRIPLDEHSSPFIKILNERSSCALADSESISDSDSTYSELECAHLYPLVYQNERLGVMAIRYGKQETAKVDSSLSKLISVVARFIAIALANGEMSNQRKENERSKAQLEIASEIQRSLLPSEFPQNEHCRLTGKCVTAQAVGGDYIDAIEIRGKGLLLIIADVMGKGVPAALLATIFRTAIRSRLNLAETPGWLLSKIDEQIHEELGHLNMFITAQAAYFSYDNKSLKLSSAGHCPAFLMRKGETTPEELTAEGIPLGINPTDIYEERIINLDTGDRLLFITDGIYEIENESGQMLGIEGFAKLLPEIWQEGLDAVPEKTLSFVASHSQNSEFQDDKTLMALEVL